MTQKKPKKPLNKYLRFTGIGFQMAGIIYLGNLLGEWFQNKYKYENSEDIITLIAVFLAMYTIIVQVIRMSNEK